jgi:hypothetical protein
MPRRRATMARSTIERRRAVDVVMVMVNFRS